MTHEDKTRDLLNALDRRPTLTPRLRPTDSKIASTEQLPWKTTFSVFNPKHMRVATELIKILINAKEFDEYMDIIDEIRQYENDGLFLYCLYSSVKHRDDCKGVVLPPIEERSPHWFFTAETIHEAIQLSVHQPEGEHIVINQVTADVTESESRLSYFREDIAMNRHHWSWHVVYPTEWDETALGKVKDRKGELFYYMHQQMLARYDCERLSNYLKRVEPLDYFYEELEAYFPHMTSQTTGVHFSGRPPGLTMHNVSEVTLQDMEVWRLRILDAIDQGYLRDVQGNRVSLADEKGIDVLGAVVESSSTSINRTFYGDLHVSGHTLISSCHDPKNRFRQHPGVMGFSESAIRDPIFYRWHKFIDNIFTRHKNTLTPYTREELTFNGIKFVGAAVNGRRKNIMETFMREGRSDLSHAPFLRTNGKILVQYEHLDHEALTFTYTILNETREDKDVTIRVFMAPKLDTNRTPFEPNQQRVLMIELDKVQERLKPGISVITRYDTNSSVTLPREIRSYRSLKAGNVGAEMDYCSCGWPEHMLIPKGTTSGMDFSLFAMCTDYNKDKPDGPNADTCKGAISYCGSRDSKYPDKKPMGYPFDRRIEASSMAEFLTDNMTMTDVKIIFSNKVHPITDWTASMYTNI